MPKITEIHLTLPALTREYHFLHLSDAHTAYAYPEDKEETKAYAKKQSDFWGTDGKNADTVFEEILACAAERRAEGLFMTGDCVDHYTPSNVRYMGERLTETGIEALYVCGNHEGAGYPGNKENKRAYYPIYRDLISPTPDLWVRDFGEFLVVGVDNSDHDITQEQLDRLTEVFGRGLPVLLLMHIPLSTEAILPEIEKKWGPNPTYFMLGTDAEPELTREFCRIVTAEDSPVAAVFAGHVHLAHQGEFAPGRLQFTAAPGECWDVFLHPEA